MAILMRFFNIQSVIDLVITQAKSNEGNPAITDSTQEYITVTYPDINAWNAALSRIDGKVKYWRIQ